MKIAVTGASGHVGNNLCRMLVEAGHQVKALIHRDIKGLSGLPVEPIRGDVTSEADLANLCAGCEVVFHLAAYISIRRNDPLCMKINFESCHHLVRAARKEGLRKIIHFSSIHAFRHNHVAELNESCGLAHDSKISYDRSKAWSQKLMIEASANDLEITVLSPTAIIGPHDYKPSLTGHALIRFYKGQIPALIPGGYDWVDVRDICRAAINAIDQGKAGTCYLLSGSWQNLRMIGREIENLGGCRMPALELPFWMAQLGEPFLNIHSFLSKKVPLYTSVSLHTLKYSHRNISSEKAKLALDYNPRPIAATLYDTITWFRENNYL
jgi:dihydroflavonol-4-reductase